MQCVRKRQSNEVLNYRITCDDSIADALHASLHGQLHSSEKNTPDFEMKSGVKFKLLSLMWCHQESNRGHKDFQSFALPTELWHHHVFLPYTTGAAAPSSVKASAKVVFFICSRKFFRRKMLIIEKIAVPLHLQTGCSAVGSALRSGRRGRAFESPHPDSTSAGKVKPRLRFSYR